MKVSSQVLTSPIVCQANTEYDLTGTTLERKSRGYCMHIPPGVNGVRIIGDGVLIGGGIDIPNTDGTIIDGPIIRDLFSGDEGGGSCGIRIENFRNSKLLNTRVINAPHTAYWFWKSLHRSVISRNLSDVAGEGFHSFHRGGALSEDVLWEYNECRKSRRHGFELQNYGIMRRWTIRGNKAHDWVTRSDWPGHMAFSLACGQSKGTQGVETDKGPAPYINDDFLVENNVALATGDFLDWLMGKGGADGKQRAAHGSSCAFELMGNFTFRNNYIDGFSHIALLEYTRPGQFSLYKNTYLKPDGFPEPYWDTYTGYEAPPARDDGHTIGKSGSVPVPPAGINGGTPGPIPPQPTMPVITEPAGDKLEVGKEYECKGAGTGTLVWGVDRIGDGAPDIASGSGNGFKFKVPSDSIPGTHTIEVKMRDDKGNAQPKVFALVPPPATTKRTVKNYTIVPGKAIFEFTDGETQVMQ